MAGARRIAQLMDAPLPVFPVHQSDGVNVGALAIASSAAKPENRLDLCDVPQAPQPDRPAPR